MQLNKIKTIISQNSIEIITDSGIITTTYFSWMLSRVFLTNFNIAKIRRSHLLLRDKGEKKIVKRLKNGRKQRTKAIALENENDYLKK